MDEKLLGQIIKEKRKKKGYTQEDLAKKIGISVMSIRRYEAGERTITDDVLSKITKGMDLPDDYFAVIYEARERQLKAGTTVSPFKGRLANLFAGYPSSEPTEQEKNDLTKIIQEIGLPSGSGSVAEAQQVIRRVAEIYGDKPAYLLKILSIMDESGVDSVIDYAKSIFQEHIDGSITKTEPPTDSD